MIVKQSKTGKLKDKEMEEEFRHIFAWFNLIKKLIPINVVEKTKDTMFKCMCSVCFVYDNRIDAKNFLEVAKETGKHISVGRKFNYVLDVETNRFFLITYPYKYFANANNELQQIDVSKVADFED